METLAVYLNDIMVGRLDDENGELSFSYDTDYIETSQGEPLSYALPLRQEVYEHGAMQVVPTLGNPLPTTLSTED